MSKFVCISGIVGLLFAGAVIAQVADAPDDSNKGIPVNYTEAKAGSYTLPDPLKLTAGDPVRTPEMWFQKRRPEIVRLFEENQYGRMPGRPAFRY